jgi:4-hydroxybenzoyl-CoA thioesterase
VRPFAFQQKVLFRHCDPAGIVFYPRYFEIINDCVEAFFEALGDPFEAMHAAGRAVPTARIETEFRRPSRHGDRLTLELACRRLGRTSLDLAIEGAAGEERRFTARSTLVHVGRSMRPEPWPPALREALADRLDQEDR